MRRLALGVALLLTAPFAAEAQTCPVTQTTPAFTAGGSVFGRIAAQWNSYFGAKVDANNGVLCSPTLLGNVTFPNAVLSVARVENNAGLKAIVAPQTTVAVERLGFTTRGDGGAALYTYSFDACSLNSGAGDDGLQVKPTVASGCWVAQLTNARPTPKIWGCVGDGAVVETDCVQAAMTAMAGNTLWTGPYVYKLAAQVSYCGRLIGERSQVVGGFIPSAANVSLVKLTCGGAEMDGVLVEMGAFTNTAGVAIDATSVVNANSVHDNYINAPFVGIDLAAGALKSAMHNAVINIRTNGVGVRVGHGTTAAGTLETQVAWNWLSGDSAGTNVTCVLYEDVGGFQHSHNTAAQCSTKIVAGTNQIVAFGFIDGELGDFNATGGTFQLDTTATSAKIYSLDFTQVWASSALLGDCYDVRNSGGGLVTGIRFHNPRAYNCYAHGMLIGGGTEAITGVEIINPTVCGASGVAANTDNGITVQSVNNTGGKIIGGKIGNDCDNIIGPVMGTGIFIDNSAPGWQIYNVDLTAATGTGGAINATLPYGAGSRWINNPGYAPTSPYTITVAASPFTYTPGPSPETINVYNGTLGPTGITIGGVTVCNATPCTFDVGPLQAAVVDYIVIPTMISTIHP